MKASRIIPGLLFAVAALAQQPAVPRVTYFNGIVTDAAGKPQTGTIGVIFSLYEEQQGGAALWSETQNVALDEQGRYSVLLGSAQPAGLPPDLFASGKARWLGVAPQGAGFAEQARVLLAGVPYALKAADADTLGGLPASAFLQATGMAAVAAGEPIAHRQTAAAVSPNTACASVTSDGTATANSIAVFTTACNIEPSTIVDSGGKVGIGTSLPTTALDVKGTSTLDGAVKISPTGGATASAGADSYPLSFAAASYNSSTSASVSQVFEWQAQPVGNDTASPSASMNLLYASGSATPANTGFSFGSNGVVSFAAGQTFAGNYGGSHDSVYVGTRAGNATSTGEQNAALGFGALTSDTYGGFNLAAGYGALWHNTSGDANTAMGDDALFVNTTGTNNTAAGASALYNNTTGAFNAAVGYAPLSNLTTGGWNIAIGSLAGENVTTGSNNIEIGNEGSSSDSGLILIGTQGTQNATYIAGISGVNVSGAQVVVSSSGQLGVASSSRRYKEDIRDMADASDGLMKLRPVTFRYNQAFPDGSKPLEYGLIAEEVAEVYPDMVVRSANGQIETVKYQELAPMLLNEVQKQNAIIHAFEERLARVEARLAGGHAQ